jgi:hypothetical protein
MPYKPEHKGADKSPVQESLSPKTKKAAFGHLFCFYHLIFKSI